VPKNSLSADFCIEVAKEAVIKYKTAALAERFGKTYKCNLKNGYHLT